MTPELKARLDKAQGAIDAHRKAREDRETQGAELRAVEAAEQEAAVVEAIATAELDLGVELGKGLERVDVFHADGSVACSVLVKTPHAAVWRRFKNAVDKDAKASKKEEAVEHFVRPCIVWPKAEDVSSLADKFPRLMDIVADACANLAGAKEEDTRKK